MHCPHNTGAGQCHLSHSRHLEPARRRQDEARDRGLSRRPDRRVRAVGRPRVRDEGDSRSIGRESSDRRGRRDGARVEDSLARRDRRRRRQDGLARRPADQGVLALGRHTARVTTILAHDEDLRAVFAGRGCHREPLPVRRPGHRLSRNSERQPPQPPPVHSDDAGLPLLEDECEFLAVGRPGQRDDRAANDPVESRAVRPDEVQADLPLLSSRLR